MFTRLNARPASAYAAAEIATTAMEIAAGYDGPPIIPGPGDMLRIIVHETKAGGQSAKAIVEAFGGKRGSVPGAINFDIIAERGIRGDVTNLAKHFNNQLDEIVASNPFIDGGTGIVDWLPGAEQFLRACRHWL